MTNQEALFGRAGLFTRLPVETVWKILSTSQSPYHEPRHRDVDERFSGGAKPLVVLTHPTVLIADCNDIGPLRFVEHVCFFRRATREDRSRPQVCHSNEQGRLVQ